MTLLAKYIIVFFQLPLIIDSLDSFALSQNRNHPYRNAGFTTCYELLLFTGLP
jgi:hypothetical protein